MKIEILYQDDFILAVNKPPAMPVHATSDPLRPHVQGIIEKQVGQKLVLAHRLDLDTTGVLLFGVDPSINRELTDLFRERRAQKTYLMCVEGRWPQGTTKIETYIRKVSGGRYENKRSGKPKEKAITNFEVIKTGPEYSFLRAKPHTGKTHQLRIHAKFCGHPILGDSRYGAKNKSVPMALHAQKLEFKHMVTAKNISIEAPLPEHWPQ